MEKTSKQVSEYEASACSGCLNNNGISCAANGDESLRVKCEVKGNVSPKVFCSEAK